MCPGLWPELGLLNHSCAPNAFVVVISNRAVVRAATAIPAGGEVTVTYLGKQGAQPRTARRDMLQRLYGFECNCVRCQVGGALLGGWCAARWVEHGQACGAMPGACAALGGGLTP